MPTAFTQYSDESIWAIDADDARPEDALEYLNNPDNFRPFSSGLTELLRKYGYEGADDDMDAKIDFLLSKLSSIHVSIAKATVKDWFRDRRRPGFASTSRAHMFEICFALSASLDDIKWFFSHVYFDRVFNCHTATEAVYYYCFTRQLPYSHAQDLIQSIQALPSADEAPGHGNLFTKEIRDRLDRCSSDEELLRFFKENKDIFSQWNRTASNYINHFVKEIKGKPADKAVIESRRLGKVPSAREIKTCGLVIQEYLTQTNDGLLDYIAGKNISSVDFMLERMIMVNSGINKETKIPDIVKYNFPSKKTFSDIFTKSENYTSYNAIRKCLILLKFYHFWATLLLEPNPDVDCRSLFDIYRDETNALLIDCGYEDLFPGNPYDWLFLWASTATRPLDTLRSAISTLDEGT